MDITRYDISLLRNLMNGCTLQHSHNEDWAMLDTPNSYSENPRVKYLLVERLVEAGLLYRAVGLKLDTYAPTALATGLMGLGEGRGLIFTDLENKTTKLDQQNQEMESFTIRNRDAIIIGIQLGKLQAHKEQHGDTERTPEETADYFLGGV